MISELLSVMDAPYARRKLMYEDSLLTPEKKVLRARLLEERRDE